MQQCSLGTEHYFCIERCFAGGIQAFFRKARSFYHGELHTSRNHAMLDAVNVFKSW